MVGHHAGPGRYETLIEVGRLDGAPMLLFTAPHGIDHVEHTQPSPAYLAMLADGLRAVAAVGRRRRRRLLRPRAAAMIAGRGLLVVGLLALVAAGIGAVVTSDDSGSTAWVTSPEDAAATPPQGRRGEPGPRR